MELRSVKDIKILKGKRVLLRLDLDLPLGSDGQVSKNEDWRLQAALPTLKFLLKKGAHLIIVGHRGRPFDQAQGKPWRQSVPDLTLKPVVQHLTQILGVKTGLSHERLGSFDAYMFRVAGQEHFVLENIRFQPGEELNDRQLAKDLANLADVFVNEAFAVAHRWQASVVAVTQYLPNYAGLNLVKEVAILAKVLKRPVRPLTIIVGGVKAETKLKLVEKFIPRADYILLGSALANNFYQALGFSIGASSIEPQLQALVKQILARPKYRILARGEGILLRPEEFKLMTPRILNNLRKQVILPMDVIVAKAFDVSAGQKDVKYQTQLVQAEKLNLASSDTILDIGPQTTKLYQEIIKRSKTIIWNGPMGLFEIPPFDRGTYEVAKAVTASRGKAIVGGGDTIVAVNSEQVTFRQNVFISTGGGAMLEFLLNPRLPGIVPLIK